MSQVVAKPIEARLTEASGISIKLLATVATIAASIVLPAIGFGVHIITSLGEITTELRLLRQEFGQHTSDGHHDGVVRRSEFRAILSSLGHDNPELTIRAPVFDD